MYNIGMLANGLVVFHAGLVREATIIPGRIIISIIDTIQR
jgi:hypothetical protein